MFTTLKAITSTYNPVSYQQKQVNINQPYQTWEREVRLHRLAWEPWLACLDQDPIHPQTAIPPAHSLLPVSWHTEMYRMKRSCHKCNIEFVRNLNICFLCTLFSLASKYYVHTGIEEELIRNINLPHSFYHQSIFLWLIILQQTIKLWLSIMRQLCCKLVFNTYKSQLNLNILYTSHNLHVLPLNNSGSLI